MNFTAQSRIFHLYLKDRKKTGVSGRHEKNWAFSHMTGTRCIISVHNHIRPLGACEMSYMEFHR